MDVVDIGQDGRGLWQSFRVVGQTEQSKLETGGGTPICTNFTKNIEVAVGRFFVFQ